MTIQRNINLAYHTWALMTPWGLYSTK